MNLEQALTRAPSFDTDWFDVKVEHKPCHMHADVTQPFQADPRCLCQMTITYIKCSYEKYMKKKAEQRMKEENEIIAKAREIMTNRGMM